MVTRLWLIVLSLISNILALALPLALIQVYDRILANQAVGTAIVIFSAVALAIVLDGLVKYARSSILGRLAAQAEYELSLKTAEKLLSIDPRKLAGFSPGRIRELFTAINRSNDVLIGQSTLALFDAPFAIAFLVLVWFLGGPTVFGPLFVLLVFGAFALFSAYRQAQAGLTLFEASADEATLLMNRREQIDRIIADGELGDFAGSLRLHEKRKAAAQEISESNLAASLNLSQTGGLATTVLVLGVGSLVVLSGDMTTGGLAACLILGQRGVAGLLGLVTALARHRVSASAFGNIQSLLALPSVTLQRATAPQGRGTVGLGFEVNGNRLECAPGSCLIVRSSDEQHGASVFRSLVLALDGCEADRSAFVKDVEVFSADGKPMPAPQYRVSVCDADLTVFNGTLLENMTAFDTEATGRAVWLSEQLGLADAIGRLRDGLETRLAPGLGVPLSDGHLKRLMLVRALSGDPHLLLLRHPSLFLDARGVDQLAALLKTLEGKVTTVVFDNADGLVKHFDAIADLPSLPTQKREAAA
ncbi:ATP-binding cassette subfamily C protein LapB [Labrenzia sp. MBR-25]